MCVCKRRLRAGGAQVTLCEQLQGYLTKHQDAAKSAEGSMGDKAAVAPLDGMAIYTRKKVPPPPLQGQPAMRCPPAADSLRACCQNKFIAGCACA